MSTNANLTTPIVSGKFLKHSSARKSIHIAVESPEWFDWLELPDSTIFYCNGYPYNYTARRETRRNKHYWYAYMKLNDVLYKVYMGKSAKLTTDYIQKVIPQKLDDKYYS